jgi:hypothetical protein
MKTKNTINLKSTREFIHDDDMTMKDKLQCLIIEGANIDTSRNDVNIPNNEHEYIRLMFKQIFMELFNQQDEWDEINTVEGHFIHHPETGSIYNITEVFCNLFSGISLQAWIVGIGGRIFNVIPEFYDENFDYHNFSSGKIKLSEFDDIFEKKLKAQKLILTDVISSEDIPTLEHKWKLDNLLITELDYFVHRLEMELVFNPHTIQRVQLRGENDDAIDILILDQSVNVVEIYRKLRNLHTPDEAASRCFDILHEILYNGVVKVYNDPLNEFNQLSLGV